MSATMSVMTKKRKAKEGDEVVEAAADDTQTSRATYICCVYIYDGDATTYFVPIASFESAGLDYRKFEDIATFFDDDENDRISYDTFHDADEIAEFTEEHHCIMVSLCET